MRKRNIIIGIAILEILSIPAAAHLHSNLDFKNRVNVIAAEIEAPNGVKSYFITSDGPFIAIGKDLTGKAMIALNQTGQLGDVSFGETAQLPGPSSACVDSLSAQEQIIYTASQATVTEKADVLSGTVLFTLFHDSAIQPEIRFVQSSKAGELKPTGSCR